MIPFLDMNERPIGVGDRVEVKFLSGRYGETRTLRGKIVALDTLGGMTITLEGPGSFTVYSKFDCKEYGQGDDYYICNGFDFCSRLNARVGKTGNDDFEHGYQGYCVLLEGE